MWFYAELFVVEAAGEGFVFADDIDAAIGGDFVFHGEAPIGAVDDEAAEAGVFEVFAATHGGVEDAGLFALAGGPVFEPDDGEGFQFLVVGAVRFAAEEWLAPDEGGAAFGQAFAFLVCAIDIGESPDVFHAGEDGVVFHFRDDVAASGVLRPDAVMVEERAADDFGEGDLFVVDEVGDRAAEAVVGGA